MTMTPAACDIDAWSPNGTEIAYEVDASIRIMAEDGSTALDSGDPASACGMLGGFANHVAAQSGKKIEADDAAALISEANDLKAQLGCASR